DLRFGRDQRNETGGSFRRARPDHKRQLKMTGAGQGRDDGAILLDQRQETAALPDRKGLALDDGDIQRRRINLAHSGAFDPWQALDALARLFGVEADQRGPAIEPDAIKNIDFRCLAISGDTDFLDGEA